MPSRMSRFAVGILLAALPALTVACGSAKPIHYYSLEMLATPPAAGDPMPVALILGRFTAPIVYRDTRLLYRSGPNQVDIYDQQRWAEPPADLVRGMLLRLLQRSGRYRSVDLMGTNAQGDYIVRGRVIHFEEVDTPSLSARVAFEVELYDPAKGITIWSHVYQQDEPSSGKDVPSVVAAINRNVQRGLGEVVGGLDQYFAQHPPSARAAKSAP